MPLDVGRVTHLAEQMHRSEDDAGDPIDDGFLLAADGARGLEWVDPATFTFTLTAAEISALGFRGELVIASVHSTPLIFDDLVQNSDGDDLVYADT